MTQEPLGPTAAAPAAAPKTKATRYLILQSGDACEDPLEAENWVVVGDVETRSSFARAVSKFFEQTKRTPDFNSHYCAVPASAWHPGRLKPPPPRPAYVFEG